MATTLSACLVVKNGKGSILRCLDGLLPMANEYVVIDTGSTDGTMELKRRLTHSDLQTPHPFNTYRNKGLPPAPICNPGRDSIQAVLKPQKTNEIYFVADGTGGHVFARSFDEHRRNIMNWKKVRKQKRLAARQKKSITKDSSPVRVASIQKTENDVAVAEARELEKQEEMLEQEDLSLDIIDDSLEEALPEETAPTQPLVTEKKKTEIPAGFSEGKRKKK